MTCNIDKREFDCIVCDIQVLNNKLSYWLDYDNQNFENAFDYYKNCDYFVNFRIDNCEFLDSDDFDKLDKFDHQITDKKLSYDFEKSVLLKRKNLAIQKLDIALAINLSKLITGVTDALESLQTEIDKVVNIYTDKIKSKISEYNEFEKEYASNKSTKQIFNSNRYDKDIVSIFRVNRISENIANEYKRKEFDLDNFFEQNIVKELLSNDYFKVKQKVGVYVGANS